VSPGIEFPNRDDAPSDRHAARDQKIVSASTLAWIVSCIWTFAHYAAQAQQAESPAANVNQAGATQAEDTVAEDMQAIVVTARRRDERLQDVPSAVTAIGAQALERGGANNLADIESAVPNLSLHVGDAKNAVVYLRGVGQVDSLAFADPGVGIYIDDVYLGRAQGSFLDVIDAQRIEVLRGPQGTLYGRNTIGGAVKFVTNAPSSSPELRLEATGGNHSRREIKAVGNLPIGDRWAARVSAAKIERDGYAENSVTGRDDGDQDTFAWRAAIRGSLSDAIDLVIAVDQSKNSPRTSRTPARMTPVFGVVPPNTDPFRVDADFAGRDDLDVLGASATLTWELNDQLTLKSITAYREMQYDTELDLDATALAFFGVYVNEDQDQRSQELQLSFDGERVDGVAGLYWFRETDFTISGLFGPAIQLITGSVNDQVNRSYAGYGQFTWKFNDRLSSTLGIRYTKEEKDFRRTQEFFAPTTPFPVPLGSGLQITSIDTDGDWSSVSPRAGLEYKFSDSMLGYVSASRGFKSGGFDGRSNTAAQAAAYDPETLWAYEVGLKSTFAGGRTTLNVAAFYNDYKNLQLSSFVADQNGNFAALFTNAGAATMQGVDIELNARLTDQFTLSAAVGLLDSEYDKYIGPGGQDISGQRKLVNAPKVTARLSPTFVVPIGEGRLTFGSDISYRSKTYPVVSSSEVLAQNGFTLFNASIGWESAAGNWRVAAVGKNLGDKRYVTHGFDLSDSLGYQLGYFGDPRTYGLTVRWQY